MKQMTKKMRLSIIHVDTEKFCNTCLPYPQTVLNAVFAKLPVIAARRNLGLLSTIRVATLCTCV